MIMPDVITQKGSVLAAGAVVSRDVETQRWKLT